MIFLSSTVFEEDILRRADSSVFELISNIELSGGNGYYPRTDLIKRLDNLIEKGVENLLIHNYFPPPKNNFVLNFASGNRNIVRQSMALADRSLELCQQYNIPYYSFHPGYLFDGVEGHDGHFEFSHDSFLPYEKALDRFMFQMERLCEKARKRRVGLAVENLFVAPGNVKTSLCCSFEEMQEIMSLIPADVGILLDLGHLNISSEYIGFDKYDFISKFMKLYSDRIYQIHLSRNDGTADQHLPFYKRDWQLEILKEFKFCPGKDKKGINVVLEARNLDMNTIIDNVKLIERYL